MIGIGLDQLQFANYELDLIASQSATFLSEHLLEHSLLKLAAIRSIAAASKAYTQLNLLFLCTCNLYLSRFLLYTYNDHG